MCTNSRIWLYRDLTDDPYTQFFAWIALPVCLILFSAGFVHLVAPQSIGELIIEFIFAVEIKTYKSQALASPR